MISMTVNGQPCDPTFCLIAKPGQYTFQGSAFATGQVVDTTYSIQSINPQGSGGSVAIVVAADTPGATSVSIAIGGNGAAACDAVISGSQIVETTNASVGPNASTGGDCQAQWIAAPPTPPTPPTPPQPPCTTCQPPPPPDIPPVNVPTLDAWGMALLPVFVVVIVAAVWRR